MKSFISFCFDISLSISLLYLSLLFLIAPIPGREMRKLQRTAHSFLTYRFTCLHKHARKHNIYDGREREKERDIKRERERAKEREGKKAKEREREVMIKNGTEH